MSEHKRTSLTTIGTNKRDKKPKQQSKTLRFVLSLPEPNEEACPEFNYTELLKSAERKVKDSVVAEGPELNGLDPLAEDDDEQVRQIARHFEAKYGGSGKTKPGRFEDYVDVGAGYDETDSFIDNTDAYDEFVPEEMTTAHGGFYINCGPLEFRKVADYSDGEDNLKDNKPKKIKRTLSAGEGNESDGKSNYVNCAKKPKVEGDDVVVKTEVARKKIVTLEEHEAQQKKKRKKQHLSADELHRKKAATVKELLKEKREFLEMDNIPSGPEGTEPKKSIPTLDPDSRINSSITDVIESVVNAAHANEDSNKESEGSFTKSTPGSVASDSDNSHDGQGLEASEKETGEAKDDSKLPDNLSDELYDYIEALKKSAKSSAEGKCKFFSAAVNNILLRLEKVCQDLPSSTRHNIYAHLSAHLPCTKDTLMKRAKKLYLEHQEVKIRKPLTKLKLAIDTAMPTVLESYTRACQNAMEEKSAEDSNGNSEGTDAKKDPAKSKIPKRKFPWTEEIKALLRQVVQQKIQCLAVLRPRRELPQDVMMTFLEKEVRVLWPPGWMKVSALLHVCQDILAHPASRMKRAHQAMKKLHSVGTSVSPVPPPQIMSPSMSRPSGMPQVSTISSVSVVKSVGTPSQGQVAVTSVSNIGARVAASAVSAAPATSNSAVPPASVSVTSSVSPTKFLKASSGVSLSTVGVSSSVHSNSGASVAQTVTVGAAARPVVKSSSSVVSPSVQVTQSSSMGKPAKSLSPVVSSHAVSVTPVVNSNKHAKNASSLPVFSQLSASVSITPTISRTKSAMPLAPSTVPPPTNVMLNKTLYGDVTITKTSNIVEKIIEQSLAHSSAANSKPKRSGSPVTLDLSPSRMNRTPSPVVSVGNSSKTKGAVDLSVNKTSPPSASKSSSPSLSLNIPDCISVLPSSQSSAPSASSSPMLTVTPKSHVSLKQRILKETAAEASGGEDDGVKVIEIRTLPKGLDANLKNSSAKPRSKRVEHTATPKTEPNTVSDGSRPNIVSSSGSKEEPTMSEKEAEIRRNEQETEAATDILSQLINESLTGGASSEQVVESPLDGTEESSPASRPGGRDPPQPADAEKSVQLEMARVMEKLMELRNAAGEPAGEAMGSADPAKQEALRLSAKSKEGGVSSKRVDAAQRRVSRGGFQEEFQKHVMKREEENSLLDSGTHPSAAPARNSNSQINDQALSDECADTHSTNPSVPKAMPAMMPCSEMANAWSGSGDVDAHTGFHFLGQLFGDKFPPAHTSKAGSNQHSSS
ncbi:ubinuclein-2 isoform X2 [Bacillus rossius redtenbacheri]|uniref:ubinuclein-2 isoform X2 n=1 Tax=Bacillus rossius redtenbacheri TaxID=93214 RepID=UPI002FDDEE44